MWRLFLCEACYWQHVVSATDKADRSVFQVPWLEKGHARYQSSLAAFNALELSVLRRFHHLPQLIRE